MIYIQKQEEPERYRRWRSRPEASYGKMKGRVRRELRNSLLTEQGFVCCFCGCAIGRKESDTTVTQIYPLSSDAHNIHNAHIIPQSVAPQLSLDYGNICASCDSSDSNEKHCIIEDKKENPTDYDGISEKRKALIDFARSVPEDKADLVLKVIQSIVEAD